MKPNHRPRLLSAMVCNLIRILICAFVLGSASTALAELKPEHLLLIVNRQAPDGVQLAVEYARARGVPADHVLQLDLPPSDEISLDDYERQIAIPVRAELFRTRGRAEIRCLVTFTGVPFRIGQRAMTPELRGELFTIASDLAALESIPVQWATRAEVIARRAGKDFQPISAAGVDGAVARLQYAVRFAVERAGKLTDAAERKAIESLVAELAKETNTPAATLLNRARAATRPSTTPATATAVLPATSPATSPAVSPQDLDAMVSTQFSPSHRAAAREAVARTDVLNYVRLLQLQTDYLSVKDTESAVDNELAAVLWGPYARVQWHPNPLHYRYRGPANPTLMVMRLDGPTPAVVRQIIRQSIETEKAGLRGRFAIDSRGIPAVKPGGAPDGYGLYDQTVRNLHDLVTNSTSLDCAFDDIDKVFPPDSMNDIALYCGWYEPNKVVIPGKFVPGAVAFHIASFTAVGLHGQGGGWWVPALLSSGAVASLGPVSEPYLTAFPPADAYFGLLMTGRLTLAEVYWRTTPFVSWKMLAIGDPLYRPFASNPALAVDQLPPELQPVLSDGR